MGRTAPVTVESRTLRLPPTPVVVHADAPFDHELIEQARSGSQRAIETLLDRYRPLARYKTRRYFIPGAEYEDLLQEAMLGLFSAIRHFDADKGSFTAFAGLCIERQIHTAVKTANRQRNRLFEDSVRLDASAFHTGDPDLHLIDTLQDTSATDPSSLVEAADEIERVHAFLSRTLTEMEAEVLRMHREGRTYEDMAGALKLTIKAVDNALQRVRRKMRIFLDEARPDRAAGIGARYCA